MIKREKMNQTVTVVNKITGEMRQAELYKLISVDTKSVDQFYQQYANGVLAACGIKPDYCAKVFMYLCMESNDNEIVVDKFMRNEIIKHCKISSPAITKALDTLHSNGIISRVCRGRYRINERYAWSGTSAERAEILKGARIDVRISIMPNEEIFDVKQVKDYNL